jgi:hypothetical protein
MYNKIRPVSARRGHKQKKEEKKQLLIDKYIPKNLKRKGNTIE